MYLVESLEVENQHQISSNLRPGEMPGTIYLPPQNRAGASTSKKALLIAPSRNLRNREGSSKKQRSSMKQYFELGFISGIAVALIAVWAAFEVMS